ncbi:MAG: hypothetical protein ACREQC_18475, partial [Candidatus Binataceae bacterium]
DAVYFGLLAALALLTKPAAGCLAFVPPLAIALTGKYRLLKRPALWGSGAIVLATCLPWYLMVGHLTFYGASKISLVENVRRTLPMFFLESVRQLSFLAALFLVGVFARLRRRGPVSGVAAVLIVLPAGVLGVSLLARVDFEPRFLIPAILPILAVAGYGAAWMATRLPIRSVRKPWLVGAACAICTIAYAGASKTPSPLVFAGDGIDELVTRLLQVSEGPETAILIAGPTGGADGRMIASIAERLPARPRETLLRATKILAQSDWNGTNYFCRFTRPEQVIEELDSDGVSLIALDESSKWPSRWPHENLLIATIDKYPERLQPVYSSSDSAYRLYRFSPAHQ